MGLIKAMLEYGLGRSGCQAFGEHDREIRVIGIESQLVRFSPSWNTTIGRFDATTTENLLDFIGLPEGFNGRDFGTPFAPHLL